VARPTIDPEGGEAVKTVALLVAFLLAGSLAWPAGNEAEGKVKTWDATSSTVTLEDGTTLTVPESVAQRGEITEGVTVKASYEEKDGKKVVSQMEVKRQ
jgi:Cu/Ag efflux protein CusF